MVYSASSYKLADFLLLLALISAELVMLKLDGMALGTSVDLADLASITW